MWDKQEKVKNVVIQNNLPYLVTPLVEEEKYRNIKLPMHAVVKEEVNQDNRYCLKFMVFGDFLGTITDILIRDTKNVFQELCLPAEIDRNGNETLEFELALLNQLSPGTYSIYLRYNDYLKINIRKHSESKLQIQNVTFYKTVYSNIGLKIGLPPS